VLSQIASNPEVLMNKEALADLEATLGPGLTSQFLDLVKSDLSTAITSVFTIGAAVIVVAFVTTWFLKEHPLKRSHEPTLSE
jgi:hypothetical protein